jgi:iron only hydrogenase large subunit-like protein
VKPIKAKKQAGRGHAVLRLEGAGGAEDAEDDRAAVARITLNDCLACSGCITSSESVLITQQSGAEFLRRLQSPSARLNLVVISPAARAAIATHSGLSLQETHGRLAGFLQGLGAHALLDCGLATDLHLVQVAAEFVARYRAAHPPAGGPLIGASGAPSDGGGGSPGPLPVLSSSCPGWVCYAEKTQGASILPFLSTVKSPQQIMGTLLKYAYAPSLGIAPQVPLLASDHTRTHE